MLGVQTCALPIRSEEHTSELQSHDNLVCRRLLEKNAGVADDGAAGGGADVGGGGGLGDQAEAADVPDVERVDALDDQARDVRDQRDFFLKEAGPAEIHPFPQPAALRV